MFWIKILKKDYASQSAAEHIPGWSQREGSVFTSHPFRHCSNSSISFLLAELLSFISKALEKEGLKSGVDNIL